MITVWRKDIGLNCVRMMERAIEGIVRAPGNGGYASLAVVEETVSLRMGPEVRDALAAATNRFGPHVRCRGYLLKGTGFVPATVRSVTAGLALMSRANAPSRVFADAAPLAEWAASYVDLDARTIEHDLELARRITSL